MSISLMSIVFYAILPSMKYKHHGKRKKSGEEFERVITISGSRAKSVLLAYADHAQDDGSSAYPSVSRLMVKTNLSRISITQAKQALVCNGYLVPDGVSKRNTDNMVINISKLMGLLDEKWAPFSIGKLSLPSDSKPNLPDSSKLGLPESSSKPSSKPKDNDIEIPQSLNTQEFMKSWADFKEHRKQSGKKMTAIAQARMLAKLSKQDVSVAVQMLETSIENGWQGVFEPKSKHEVPPASIPAIPQSVERGSSFDRSKLESVTQ